jgi:GxxExxY protein
MEHEELTGQIIQIYYKVFNELGHGFIESVYHKAMILEWLKQV